VAITALAGSACTIGATSTRPPPNRRRREPVRELPDFPVDPVRVESAPVREEGDVFSPARWCGVVPELAQAGVAALPLVAPGPVAAALPEAAASPLAALAVGVLPVPVALPALVALPAAGAMPQVSQ